ncbi:MAG: hypothetical protein Q8S84_06165 [bacterium]|nr:hypothetical protein [bacterium]MDP3381059.1 hypothetical protein [bacterium]
MKLLEFILDVVFVISVFIGSDIDTLLFTKLQLLYEVALIPFIVLFKALLGVLNSKTNSHV